MHLDGKLELNTQANKATENKRHPPPPQKKKPKPKQNKQKQTNKHTKKTTKKDAEKLEVNAITGDDH